MNSRRTFLKDCCLTLNPLNLPDQSIRFGIFLLVSKHSHQAIERSRDLRVVSGEPTLLQGELFLQPSLGAGIVAPSRI